MTQTHKLVPCEPTNEALQLALEAYNNKRSPERWDGFPPWGEAGQLNHSAGIKAAILAYIESAPEVSSIVCPKCNEALPPESAGMRRKFDHVVTNGEPV